MELLLVVAVPMAVFTFLAPGMAMVAAWSPVRYSPYPYPLSLVTCVLWYAYGAKHGLAPLYILSAGGAAVQLFYLGLFFSCAPANDDRRGCTFFLLLLAALMGIVGAVAYLVDMFLEMEYGAYGWVCCFVASFAAASPFMNRPAVKDMRETRTMRRMPPWIVPALALPNAILWTIRNWPNENSLVLLIAGFSTALVSLLLLVLHLACCMMGQPAPRDELNDPLLIVNAQQQAPDPPLPNNQEPAIPPLPNTQEPAIPEIVVENPAAHQEMHVVHPEEAKDQVEPKEDAAPKQEVNVQAKELKNKVEKIKQVVASASSAWSTSEATKPINNKTDDDDLQV